MSASSESPSPTSLGAGTVTVLALQRWAESFRRSNVGVEDFLAEVGVAPDADPAVRVSMTHVASVLDRLSTSTNTPHIGIDLALSMPPGVLGPIDYRWSASATLLEAMLRSVGGFRKFTDAIQYELHCDGADASIVQRNREVPPVIMEHFFAGLVCRMRHVSDVRVRFSAVRFAHARPSSKNTTRLDDFFGTTVEFDAEATELVFPAALLQRKLLTADAALLMLLREHPAARTEPSSSWSSSSSSSSAPSSANPAPADPFLDQVRGEVAQILSSADGDLVKKIADRLSMSSRSLQRKLGERNTSLSDIVDEARRELALSLVTQPGMLIADIAVRLGFGNVSTVFRAFRRWTGMSPRDYLKQLRAP